jgi:hypothetical protein
MLKSKYRLAFALSLAAVAGVVTEAVARPNVGANGGGNGLKNGQLKTTASCRPASAAIDLDINNIRARLMTGGDMWWDNGTSEARYEVPKFSRKNSLFAGSVWIGGYDQQGQLKVAAQTYRQSGNDYWPGPLDDGGNIDAATCNEWDRFWKINRETINKFRELKSWADALNTPDYEVIKQWPARGNQNAIGRNQNPLNIADNKDYAPFEDLDKDNIYEPENGEYPLIDGDQFIWWVFNDKGNVKGESQTEGIGLEVQASAFAYAAKDYLNDMTFYNYRLINRGNLTMDSTYIATWTDADLGYHLDDYIGCDVGRGLGILYNAKSEDGIGGVNHYGNKVPMVGVDFFKGPLKTYRPPGATKDTTIELGMESFTYYNNDFSIIGNPRTGQHIYNYMTGSITNGQRFTNDFAGPGVASKAYGSNQITNFVFSGDPDKPEWSECTCNNAPGDRRFVHSSGPFKLEPGVVNDITIGAIWVSETGGCPNVSFRKIRAADDLAQALFINDFKTIEGPEAPRMVAREMDRKLIFYLVNDAVSSNYGERFGYDKSERKYRVNALTKKGGVVHPDSLYKFEGYRVFQLKNKEVQPAQIFNERGEVNTDVAIEVFQTDVKNGVGRIVNYEKNADIDSVYDARIKVNGKDSGIRHSFVISQDAFAQGGDKRLVNYRNYYFVAVAYAYNEFAPFNINNPDETQNDVYVESAHGAGGIAIPIVAAMPNPANGDMGTVLNSDYGDGVRIKRIEGAGNGGNTLEMTAESEAMALESPYVVANPEYKPGNGPVDIKVIDPVKIEPHDWELYIEGPNQDDTAKGLSFLSTWRLVNLTNNDVIYGEKNLNGINEHIIERYGLSVSIQQVLRPGDDQPGGNGYITSDITFMDPAKPWLSGTKDEEGRSFRNWIRSGGVFGLHRDTFSLCDFNDHNFDTVLQVYEHMLANSSLTEGTWAPYTLGAYGTPITGSPSSYCAFGVTKVGTLTGLAPLPSVDIVFTSDKNKWTRCVVLEQQEEQDFSEGGAAKFAIRSHKSWDGQLDASGLPVYSTDAADTGMSWFPGYAINQETGERLNIIFGEDSWLKEHNGGDMIWNPTYTSTAVDNAGIHSKVFGGKHYVYVQNTRYDQGQAFKTALASSSALTRNNAYKTFMYVGNPLIAAGQKLLPLQENLIPTETRIRIRVTRPYSKFVPAGVAPRDRAPELVGAPIYAFGTADLAPKKLNDNPNADKQALLDRINVVPNPYYGYVGYENNRLDTRVRVINLPKKAVVSVYSLEGALIRRLEKDNANTSFIDWDIRNAKGLPVASGMYMIHVSADGIGETVLRWFGAMRPIDVVNY